MTKLSEYLNDGADNQARAVLMFLQPLRIEESWNKEYHQYASVARWENGREQGYVVSLVRRDGKQINIAFFEHRNSDNISAVKWYQNTMNAPTIETAEFGDVYKTKWDVSKSVLYGQVREMAEWIEEELRTFWAEEP